MAYIPCRIGGGGTTVVRGTASKTTTASTKITLGWKPTFVMIYNITNANAIHSTLIWDSARPNVQQYSYGNNVNLSMPTTSVNQIASIDDDGFTVNKSGTAVLASIEYIAIKE